MAYRVKVLSLLAAGGRLTPSLVSLFVIRDGDSRPRECSGPTTTATKPEPSDDADSDDQQTAAEDRNAREERQPDPLEPWCGGPSVTT